MRANNNSDKKGIRATADSTDFLLEFDTSSSEFQRGFECGEIWACLTDDVAEVHAIISASNSEMVMRMAEAMSYSFEGRYLEEKEVYDLQIGEGEWMIVVMRSSNDGQEQ